MAEGSIFKQNCTPGALSIIYGKVVGMNPSLKISSSSFLFRTMMEMRYLVPHSAHSRGILVP